MKYKIPYSITSVIFIFVQTTFGQVANRVTYNNQYLFLNGANLAWINFAGDVGPGNTDFDLFSDILVQMNDRGGNALRWWLHTNGSQSPQFNNSDYVSDPGQNTIEDIRKVLDLAWDREVGIILCLWSFDMLRKSNSATVLNRNKLLLNDTVYTRAYIENCLIPMVNSLKGHPAIIAWEIFNEPEGMSDTFGWSDIDHVPMYVIQRFVNLCAGAIHRTDSAALVTNGCWNFQALTDVTPATVMRKTGSILSQLNPSERESIAQNFNQHYRLSMATDEVVKYLENISTIANMNYYSDNRLISAGGDPIGTLDFYSVHYYYWNETATSPFHHPSATWNLTKPIVVAEFAMEVGQHAPPNIPKTKLYDTLYQLGYAGALAWSWTDTQISNPTNILAGMQSMWDNHRADVDINGISGFWPRITLTRPKADTTFADGAEVLITAEASDPDGTVTAVDFFISDTIKIGTDSTAPYQYIWKCEIGGLYTLTAHATDNDGHVRKSNKIPITVGAPPMIRLEAESATREGPNMTVRSDVTASKGSYLDIPTNDPAAKITWTLVNVAIAGTYEIAFGYRLPYGSPKTQYIYVNGSRIGDLQFTSSSTTTWFEKTMSVNLLQGTNIIQMQMSWGWMQLDYLAIPRNLLLDSGEVGPNHPNNFVLEQNYPNPFNPSTLIRYSIPKSEQVRLIVYDILGRQISTLINEKQDIGTYSIPFYAGALTSGVYYYRIEAGSFTRAKSMILLK